MKAEEIAEKEYPYITDEGEGIGVIQSQFPIDNYRKSFINGYNYDKWISVKDGLPIDNTRCLVLVQRKNEMLPTQEIAKKFEAVNLLMRNREMDDNFLIQGTVTHWQPLPDNPKGL